MKIDLGYLGTVDLEPMETEVRANEGFLVVLSGYTLRGIRVHGVVDHAQWNSYPTTWNNAILIKVN